MLSRVVRPADMRLLNNVTQNRVSRAVVARNLTASVGRNTFWCIQADHDWCVSSAAKSIHEILVYRMPDWRFVG
jgi:hypothetical protein